MSCIRIVVLLVGVILFSCAEVNRQKYFLFQEIYFDVKKDVYEVRELDEMDKLLLPEILKQYEYPYKIENNDVYIEKVLFDDKEMMQKITAELHARRGEKYWGFQN